MTIIKINLVPAASIFCPSFDPPPPNSRTGVDLANSPKFRRKVAKKTMNTPRRNDKNLIICGQFCTLRE